MIHNSVTKCWHSLSGNIDYIQSYIPSQHNVHTIRSEKWRICVQYLYHSIIPWCCQILLDTSLVARTSIHSSDARQIDNQLNSPTSFTWLVPHLCETGLSYVWKQIGLTNFLIIFVKEEVSFLIPKTQNWIKRIWTYVARKSAGFISIPEFKISTYSVH